MIRLDNEVEVSKLSIGRIGSTAVKARRGARGAYKVTDAPGRTQQRFNSKANAKASQVKTKVYNARQRIHSPEQWNNAANAAILGTGVTAVGTAGGVAAYKDHKEKQKELAKADFAGVKSALKAGQKYVKSRKPQRPSMPAKDARENMKRGYKAAENKQSHASSGAYVVGAAANKLKAPVLATGAVGAGVEGHKAYQGHQENNLYKSMEPEWVEFEKFRIPSAGGFNPAVAARGVKTTVGNMTSRSGGNFVKPSLTAKGPAGKVKIGGGLTGAGKVAAGGTAAVGAGGIMSHNNKKQGMAGVTKMDAIEIYKAKQKEASTGRKVAGTVFGPYHAAVAGKGGKKLGAVGSSLGHGIAGATAGSVAGTLVGTRLGGGKGAAVGNHIGSVGGASAGYLRSVKTNQAKGRYKKEIGKSDVLSAFGVEHVSKASDNFKAGVWNGDVVSRKLGGNGKYNKGERKIARKAMRREEFKGQAKGTAAGAAGGAAAGVGASVAYGSKLAHDLGQSAKEGIRVGTKGSGKLAAVGALGGAVVGANVGDIRGRKKGIKRYQKEIGKSYSVSAFGIEH